MDRQLRAVMLLANSGCHSCVMQWFNTIDRDGNGELDCHELHSALAEGNLHFSVSTVARMIRLHNKNRGPRLNYAEFQQLHRFLERTQTTFAAANPDDKGTLTYDQLAHVLKSAGYTLEQQVFRRILEAFDPEQKGTIDLAAFVRLTMFLRSSSNAFSAYDPRETGRISLDFNQFLYAAANIV